MADSAQMAREGGEEREREREREAPTGAYFEEAPISREDVEKAGGFGAMDELGGMHPAAMDATDREEELREYEDPANADAGLEGRKPHFGLGSTFAASPDAEMPHVSMPVGYDGPLFSTETVEQAFDGLNSTFVPGGTETELDAPDRGVDGAAGGVGVSGHRGRGGGLGMGP